MKRNYILLKIGVRLMLHWFCGIGMSDLHDNNLVQGWEKNWKLNLVWNKKRKAHRCLLIQMFWFCHLMAPLYPLYLLNEKKQKKTQLSEVWFLRKTDKNMSLFTRVSNTDVTNEVLNSWHDTGSSLSYFKYRSYSLQARRSRKAPSGSAWLWQEQISSLFFQPLAFILNH